MSKALEELEKAKKRTGLPLNKEFAPVTIDELDIIEQALKEHEQHKAIEKELGIDLVTYFTVKRRGYIYYKALDGSIRESKVWAQFFGYDWCWYIRSPKKNDRRRVRMKHYGKTWGLTREELEK